MLSTGRTPLDGTLERVLTVRAAAAGALLTGVGGVVGLAVATDGAARIAEYVSESGVIGAPRQVLYRASIFAVAVAVGLLAVAVRGASRHAAGLLAVAVPCVALSGTVTCSAGCPLPPYETPTPADLVHAGASIAGVLLCAAAMLVLALPAIDRSVRLPSRIAAVFIVPLGGACALAILFAGRGPLTGILERTALAALLAWLVALSLVRAGSAGTGDGS